MTRALSNMILIQTLCAFQEDSWPLTPWECGHCNPIMVTAVANGGKEILQRQRTHIE